MMNPRRIAALLAPLVLIVPLLCGCNPTEATPPLDTEGAKKQPGANVPPAKGGMSAADLKKSKTGD